MSVPDAPQELAALTEETTFESGTERLNALLSRPDLAEIIKARRSEIHQAENR